MATNSRDMKQKRILVAPINWGLGHATRCIPIIKALEEEGFEPVLASDGPALSLLTKEFPRLAAEELPSYNIEYAAKPQFLRWKLLMDTPAILRTIKAEKKRTSELVEEYNLKGIISDNRFGVRSEQIKNVFITHQLNVLSGRTTWFSSKLHQKYIKKFDQCWIPDLPGEMNLSGILGHLKNKPEGAKYMGPLSRFERKDLPKKYKILCILSGPEPQRSFLEKILLKDLEKTDKKILFIRGVIEDRKFSKETKNPALEIRNYLYGKELEKAMNSSEYIVARSGYSTIMDLAKLEKKAFFIPTPGQFEQEYLAARLKNLGIADFCKQEKFKIEKLDKNKNYSGFTGFDFIFEPRSLFAFFEGE